MRDHPTTQSPPPINGKVRLQLFDGHSKRELERVDSENFVGPAVAAWQTWVQRIPFLTDTFSSLGHGPAKSIVPLATAFKAQPTIRSSHAILASGTNAEVPADEEYFHGEIIGWANKQSTYSGVDVLRGTYNAAEMVITTNTIKWVFDWPTHAANGTIGSVGFGRLGIALDNFARQDAFMDTPLIPGGVQTNVNVYGIDYDGSFLRSAAISSESSRAIYKLDPTDGTLDSTLTCSAGTGANCYGLAWIAADSTMRLLTAASSGTNTAWNIERYATGGGAMVSSITVTLGAAAALRGLAWDGTDFWTINATTGEVLRINTAGTVSATLSDPRSGSYETSCSPQAITWDGTKLIYRSGSDGTNGAAFLIALNTSGTVQWRSMGGHVLSSYTAGTRALPGDFRLTGSGGGLDQFQAEGEQNAVITAGQGPKGDICMYGTQIIGFSTATTTPVVYARIRPYALFSRTLLGSPVTKTNSQTAKLTYTWEL